MLACAKLFDSKNTKTILDWSKIKAFADNKLKELNIMICVFNRVENIVVKGGNTGNQHFLLFPQCFQKAFYCGSLTLSQTSPGFFKTLWEKEKLLVTSNFFFSHSVFYRFEELYAIFMKLKIVLCKLFLFGKV